MRLLLTVGDLHVGGAEMNVVNYAVALMERGHDVGVYAGPGPLADRLEVAGIHRIGRSVRLRKPWTLLMAGFDLAGLAAERHVEVVHSFMASSTVAAAIANCILATLGRPRYAVVSAPPGIRDRREPRLVTAARLRAIGLGADFVLAPSPSWVEILRQSGLRRDRLRLVEFNGVPLSRFRPRRSRASVRHEIGVGPEDRVVCCVARLHPTKGQDLLLQAVPSIAKRVPNLRIVLVGDGAWRNELEEIAQRLGVRETVRFLGSRSDVADLLTGTDLLVQTTFGNGGPGLSVIEAFAASRPVVAMSFPDLHQSVGESGGVLIVPHGDVAALADAVVEILLDPLRWDRMSKSARRWAEERFDIDVLAGQLEEVYAEAIVKRRRERQRTDP